MDLRRLISRDLTAFRIFRVLDSKIGHIFTLIIGVIAGALVTVDFSDPDAFDLPTFKNVTVLLTLLILVILVYVITRWVTLSQARHIDLSVLVTYSSPVPGATQRFAVISSGKQPVGAAIPIQVAPDPQRGWKLEHIRLIHDPTAPAPPEPAIENDAIKVAVRNIAYGGSDTLSCEVGYGLTRLSKTLDARSCNDLEKLDFLRLLDCGSFDFPHAFCCHGIITVGKRLLITRRSRSLAYSPGRWSASAEEQMTEADLTFGGLEPCAKRLLDEEFAITYGDERAISYDSSAFSCHSIFAESDVPNISAVVHMPLKIPLKDFEKTLQNRSRKDNEFTHYAFLDVNQVALEVAKGSNLHPTSRYRMLIFLILFAGHRLSMKMITKGALSREEAWTTTRDRELARILGVG